jgi:hypothetical protein
VRKTAGFAVDEEDIGEEGEAQPGNVCGVCEDII